MKGEVGNTCKCKNFINSLFVIQVYYYVLYGIHCERDLCSVLSTLHIWFLLAKKLVFFTLAVFVVSLCSCRSDVI